jgi:hypothetical protein
MTTARDWIDDVPGTLRDALPSSPLTLVGTPYVRGAVTPETGFDCFTLAAFVRWHYYGRHTPIAVQLPKPHRNPIMHCALVIRRMLGGRRADALAPPWQSIATPHAGCMVALGRTSFGPLHHCGVWVQGGVLHALEGVGVAFTPVDRLHGLFPRVEYFECRD